MQIYKTINLINGKIYVGQNAKDNPNYLGSGIILKRAIKKYGKENFKKEILQECKTKQELCEAEIYWIAELNAMNQKIGYNLHEGGLGGDTFTDNPNKENINRKHSCETKRKISESLKGNKNCLGRKLLKKSRKKISDANIGNSHSEETKKKLSIFNTGKHLSEETKMKIANSSKGKFHSEETKKKLSNLKKGKKFSIEHKKKLSESHKGQICSEETKKKMIQKRIKPVIQYDKNLNLIAEYKSIKEASEKNDINYSSISKVCRNQSKIAGGYIWKFKNKKS